MKLRACVGVDRDWHIESTIVPSFEWTTDPFLTFSLPTFVASFWLLRRMAPTRPTLAGAAAGFFAGAVGAATYGMWCQESAAAFVVLAARQSAAAAHEIIVSMARVRQT